MKLPGAAYLAFSAILITAVAGWSIRAVRALRNGVDLARPPLLVIMALLHVGLWCLSFWSSYTVDVALHGRYVFPTFLPFVALVIAGLSSFIAWRRRAELAVLATIPVMLAGECHLPRPDACAACSLLRALHARRSCLTAAGCGPFRSWCRWYRLAGWR